MNTTILIGKCLFKGVRYDFTKINLNEINRLQKKMKIFYIKNYFNSTFINS